MRRVLSGLLPVLPLVVLMTGCGADAPEPPALLTDWSGVDAFVVTDVDGQTVLDGVDTDRGRVDPVAVLPDRGDTRANRAARVVQTDADHFLLVLPQAGGRDGDVFEIDRAARTVTERGSLTATQDLVRLGTGFVGVGQADSGGFVLNQYDDALHPAGAVPLPVAPSYDGADAAATRACYAAGDGLHQDVAVYTGAAAAVVRTSFAEPGNTTGVACSADAVAVALGDVPGATAAPESDGAVRVSRKPGDVEVTVVAVRSGSSGKLLVDDERILTDVPAAGGGRDLVAVDSTTGAVTSVAELPDMAAVDCLELLVDDVLVVGSDQLYLARPDGSTVHMHVEGDLYDMSLQFAAGAA